jgi:hypothetical protein
MRVFFMMLKGLKRDFHQPPHQPHGQPQQLEGNGPARAEKGAARRFAPFAPAGAPAPELVQLLRIVVVAGTALGAMFAEEDLAPAAGSTGELHKVSG